VLPSIANSGSVNPTIFTAMPATVGLSVGPTPAPHVLSQPSSSMATPKPGAAFLGVSTVTNTPELDARFGLPAQAGAVVSQVIVGGPAVRAGLRDKDVITAVDGRPIASAGDLTNAPAQYHPGARVSLTVARGTQTLQFVVALGSTPK